MVCGWCAEQSDLLKSNVSCATQPRGPVPIVLDPPPPRQRPRREVPASPQGKSVDDRHRAHCAGDGWFSRTRVMWGWHGRLCCMIRSDTGTAGPCGDVHPRRRACGPSEPPFVARASRRGSTGQHCRHYLCTAFALRPPNTRQAHHRNVGAGPQPSQRVLVGFARPPPNCKYPPWRPRFVLAQLEREQGPGDYGFGDVRKCDEAPPLPSQVAAAGCVGLGLEHTAQSTGGLKCVPAVQSSLPRALQQRDAVIAALPGSGARVSHVFVHILEQSTCERRQNGTGYQAQSHPLWLHHAHFKPKGQTPYRWFVMNCIQVLVLGLCSVCVCASGQ